jgi:hypothetical protein
LAAPRAVVADLLLATLLLLCSVQEGALTVLRWVAGTTGAKAVVPAARAATVAPARTLLFAMFVREWQRGHFL